MVRVEIHRRDAEIAEKNRRRSFSVRNIKEKVFCISSLRPLPAAAGGENVGMTT
jgi:hypothetical protein